jgi:hypothetical protein
MSPGAYREPLRVGQAQSAHQVVARSHRGGDHVGGDVDESELGAAEHVELRALVVAPEQAEVAIGALAADVRAQEVLTIGVLPDRDGALPASGRGIGAGSPSCRRGALGARTTGSMLCRYAHQGRP